MKTLKFFTLILFPAIVLSCESSSDEPGPPPPAADKCNTVSVPDLAMCFSFNGTANERINDDQATVNGPTLTTDRMGNADAAYLFDGVDDYISLPNPSYQLNGSFTLSAWMFIDENTTLTSNVRLLDTRNSTFTPNNSLNIYYRPNFSQLVIAGIGVSRFTLDPNDLDQGNWFNLTVIYDALESEEKVEVYLNGLQLNMTFDGFNGHTYANEDIIIGARADLVEVFNGKIDDILLFDRAFEESELVQLLAI
ncbi:MAG: LamG domain-containing protein [Cyclobacteriaceae bacterium]|nr:LamG domain-containing protein [Cyclobacteriaceae bacterium]